MEEPTIRKKRALSSEGARQVRARGHADALEFALSIGLDKDYKNDSHAKKDVIDLSGDSHSVKSGEKKWQIFLYGLPRFETDFRAMNGIGELLIDCIKSFPPTYEKYQLSKSKAKAKLRIPMVKLAKKLQNKPRLKVFLNKALFNGGEVNYLTVKQGGIFHVFWGKDIIDILSQYLEVTNSGAKQAGQTPEQKVIFRYNGTTTGELEMRNDSDIHYREVRFNMFKPKIMKLIFEKNPLKGELNDKVLIYGNAIKHFARWGKK